MRLWSFVRKHPYVLSFGTLQIAFSAPGQTFLISLFVISIFKDLGISQSAFAGIYSFSTLAASLLLNPAGKLIDRHKIKSIVILNAMLMSLGCFILSFSINTVTLILGFFILRLIGQGVFGLTASTMMAKKFQKNRGKAMSIVSLGFSISEAIYPLVTVLLINAYGWRVSYIVFGLSYLIVMLPLLLLLIKKSGIQENTHFYPGETDVNPEHMRGLPEERTVIYERDQTLKQALKDPKFYVTLLASCLPPVVVTALFFHQETLFTFHSWPFELMAAGLFAYASAKAIGSLFIGPIVDKYGPMIPFFVLILILSIGTLFAAFGGSTFMIYLYFMLIGASLGFSSPVTNVIWPHFYGTKYIGSIKGFVATFRNGITALGPLPIALLLDHHVSIKTIFLVFGIIILLMSFLPLILKAMDTDSNL